MYTYVHIYSDVYNLMSIGARRRKGFFIFIFIAIHQTHCNTLQRSATPLRNAKTYRILTVIFRTKKKILVSRG